MKAIAAILVVLVLIPFLGCDEMEKMYSDYWGACVHADGSCTEHSYEHECYEAGGIKWYSKYEC